MIQPGDEPIPGYRCEKLLGRGQCGEVWRAMSPGRTSLALKFLDLSGTLGWKEFRSVQRVKEIRHPHLMPIVAAWLLDRDGRVLSDDVIDSLAPAKPGDAEVSVNTETIGVESLSDLAEPAQMVIATLLADKTLGDRLREEQARGAEGIPPDELIGYMAEAAKGIDYLNAHQHEHGEDRVGVQHCDIKPENLMLSGGSVVITDFGVAQLIAEQRADVTATAMGGSPIYMAPEAFDKKPSSSSDQYAFAITYYELRTGKTPFNELTIAAVFRAHSSGSLDYSGVPEPEQAVLRTATSTNPKDRYPTCAAMVHALREALGMATTATPGRSSTQAATAPAPAVATQARRPLLRLLLTLTTVAGVAAAGVWWSQQRPATAEPTPLPEIEIGEVTPKERGAERLVETPTDEKARTPPAEPKTEYREARLVVTPADATVLLNATPLELDNDGAGTVRLPAGSAAELAISAEGYEVFVRSLEARELSPNSVMRVSLDRTAASFAAAAEAAYTAGRREEFVSLYTEAVKRDADTYAVLPAPQIVEPPDPVDFLAVPPKSDNQLVTFDRSGQALLWRVTAKGIGNRPRSLHKHATRVMSHGVNDKYAMSLSYDGRLLVSRLDGRLVLDVDLTASKNAEGSYDAALPPGDYLYAAREINSSGGYKGTSTEFLSWDLSAREPPSTKKTHTAVRGRLDAIKPFPDTPRCVAMTITDSFNAFLVGHTQKLLPNIFRVKDVASFAVGKGAVVTESRRDGGREAFWDEDSWSQSIWLSEITEPPVALPGTSDCSVYDDGGTHHFRGNGAVCAVTSSVDRMCIDLKINRPSAADIRLAHVTRCGSTNTYAALGGRGQVWLWVSPPPAADRPERPFGASLPEEMSVAVLLTTERTRGRQIDFDRSGNRLFVLGEDDRLRAYPAFITSLVARAILSADAEPLPAGTDPST